MLLIEIVQLGKLSGLYDVTYCRDIALPPIKQDVVGEMSKSASSEKK